MSGSTRLLPALLLALPLAGRAGLPPVPVPPENPITEAKRVLGKILFWDEQLSADDTVACGTCHRPEAGGADPRAGKNPGTDAGTIDDVAGSPGIRRLDAGGAPLPHPVFGDAPQVTPRVAPSIMGALWAPQVFWDGRAGSTFRDPVTRAVAIAEGGALENQVLATLANDAEMAKPNLSWDELAAKLSHGKPLALASDWPDDIRAAIADRPSYPSLFEAAFGDGDITPVRIAFAIASYERTLVPDQTPWDRYIAGDETALGQIERYGWEAMQTQRCVNCHEPPLFTNNDFANIGLRRSEYDRGRERITGDAEDAGEMKVPSLRNAGLRKHFMHTGEFKNVGSAVGFYRTGAALPDRDDIPNGGIYAFNMSPLSVADIAQFIARALTDPRVEAAVYPFDRPRLASEEVPEN